jgi:hypothetical protein
MSKNKNILHTMTKLTDGDSYPAWHDRIQDYLFQLFKNVNMDLITMKDTLKGDFFKTTFPQQYKDACKDADDQKVDPLTNADFLQQCSTHALTSGQGFHDWVYDLYADLRSTLSEKIRLQTSGVTSQSCCQLSS